MTDQENSTEATEQTAILSVDQDASVEAETENQLLESAEETSTNAEDDLSELDADQLREKLKAEREQRAKIEEESKKREHGFNKSIARATAQKRTLEAELNRVKLNAEATLPKREDYTSDQEYFDASVNHRVEFDRKNAEIQKAQEQANQELIQPFLERAKDDGYAVETLSQYGLTIAQALQAQGASFDQSTAELIRESEVGHKVLEHLAKFPQDALVIARALPSERSHLIGRIESALSTAKAKPKVTNAPAPVKAQGAPKQETSGGGDTLSYIARMKGR